METVGRGAHSASPKMSPQIPGTRCSLEAYPVASEIQTESCTGRWRILVTLCLYLRLPGFILLTALSWEIWAGVLLKFRPTINP